jgi:PAS domain S-box-containing protein
MGHNDIKASGGEPETLVQASPADGDSSPKPTYEELQAQVARLQRRVDATEAMMWGMDGHVTDDPEAAPVAVPVAGQLHTTGDDHEHLWDKLLTMPIFACHLDADGIVRSPWGTGLQRMGLDARDVDGARMGDAFPELHEAIADALAGGSSVARYTGEFQGSRWRALIYLASDAGIGGAGFVGLDMTAYWALRAQLDASQRRYLALADAAPVGIVRTDTKGSCVYANETLCRVAGVPVEDLLGEGWLNMVPEGDREMVINSLVTAIESGKPGRGTWRVLNAAGDLLYVAVTSVPERDHLGDVTGYLATLNDVTQRKENENEIQQLNDELNERVRVRTEQLEAANKELEAFCYSVSHDLRAPLRSIDGFCQLLIDDYGEVLDDSAHGYMKRARVASQRMGVLIDDLLHLSRVGRATLNREPVDVTAVAGGVFERLSSGRTPVPSFSVGEGLVANADKGLVETLLENLIGNALKFTGKEEHPEIEIGQTCRKGEEQVFFVRDNGAGFDMAYAQKLFAPFERLHSPDEFEGHGVGLATVARIVARHAGWIEAEGLTGRGATFYFTLEPADPISVS